MFNSPNNDKNPLRAHTVRFTATDYVLRSTEIGVMKIPDRQSDRHRDTDRHTDRQRQTDRQTECSTHPTRTRVPLQPTLSGSASTDCVAEHGGRGDEDPGQRVWQAHRDTDRQTECPTHPTRTRISSEPTLSGSPPLTMCCAARR